MKIKYRINTSTVTDEDGNVHKTYGITVCKNRKRLKSVEDVSLNRARVALLVELCNKLKLKPVHLYDVIEDFLDSL